LSGINLIGLINLIFTLIYVAILGRIILSFVIPLLGGRPNPILMNVYDALVQVTEPILGPIRRVLPTFGMLDFSPLVAIILLQIIQTVLVRALV
jgi:YggT family protein